MKRSLCGEQAAREAALDVAGERISGTITEEEGAAGSSCSPARCQSLVLLLGRQLARGQVVTSPVPLRTWPSAVPGAAREPCASLVA